jgi:hypothetical protein
VSVGAVTPVVAFDLAEISTASSTTVKERRFSAAQRHPNLTLSFRTGPKAR